jgi:hypothetical protein
MKSKSTPDVVHALRGAIHQLAPDPGAATDEGSPYPPAPCTRPCACNRCLEWAAAVVAAGAAAEST